METIRTTITIETEEVWIIKRRRFVVKSFCSVCDREVSMIPPDEAALLLCYDITTINSLIADNRFHISYFNDVKPLICLNSLCTVS